MSNSSRSRDRKSRELVHLKDLVPKRDPKGGGRTKPVFGQRPVEPERKGPAPDDGSATKKG